MLKRDTQGKFTLKNDNYRQVRSLRLTDETWKAIGIAAECSGLTRADYLEQIVKDRVLPSITRHDDSPPPHITRDEEHDRITDPVIAEQSVMLKRVAALEILRDRVMSELKLGKQAPGYKTAQKALNRFIAELKASL
ncbi:hypothetical protein C7Y66_30230 [Chroococcidiopsis sp. CCALA 051]|uniref:hypothetical protein n=1 Tax=Chroococcidiopsis sp. CCALA 051 TaxID=869949 RepID=UPI000D0D72A6|nr:hypothetical protein [Chroococcidiopsis sp. CCALA 051]PSM45463.1 hypothetical protein C7Y66_30230 [Chroococcidiopsis sp. CCALA 051]